MSDRPSPSRPRRLSHRRRLLALATSALAVAGAAVAIAPPAAAGGSGWVAEPVCSTSAPGTVRCDALRLVRATAGTRGYARVGANRTDGPVGGYTPAEVAKAYGVDPAGAAGATQTVAIVDAFDDPSVKADLAAFDSHYGLPAETSTSFRVVSQTGGSSLPSPDTNWAGEITLDVQTVRGLCHKCKILLVESNSNGYLDMATAENEAATLHATVISNSFGGAETSSGQTAGVIAAYNHPGVTIVASSGDDGWGDWDYYNVSSLPSHASQGPASYPTVIGVGGTSLYLNDDGSRADETVWNDNGPHDTYGRQALRRYGAAGSGCSGKFAAPRWQLFVTAYSGLGCASGKRSEVDIAAIADPFTGYDVHQTFGATTPGWYTYGGTSLAAPVVAALFALAGGAHGVAYPALSLYGHFKAGRGTATRDVTVGGTGYCSTASPAACVNWNSASPNALGYGNLDCGFAASGTTPLVNRYQCYARPGYDGVSGVGTPKGLGGFAPMTPTAVIANPGTVTHGLTKQFSSSGTSDPFPGGFIASYAWSWGDGHTSTGARPTHRYAAKGTRTITLTVKDNYGRSATTHRKIVVA